MKNAYLSFFTAVNKTHINKFFMESIQLICLISFERHIPWLDKFNENSTYGNDKTFLYQHKVSVDGFLTDKIKTLLKPYAKVLGLRCFAHTTCEYMAQCIVKNIYDCISKDNETSIKLNEAMIRLIDET